MKDNATRAAFEQGIGDMLAAEPVQECEERLAALDDTALALLGFVCGRLLARGASASDVADAVRVSLRRARGVL